MILRAFLGHFLSVCDFVLVCVCMPVYTRGECLLEAQFSVGDSGISAIYGDKENKH